MSSNLKIIIFFLFVGLSMNSCRHGGDKAIEKEVKLRFNNKITLVDTLKAYSIENGWKDFRLTKNPKVVSYLNGGCGSCLFELLQWSNFITEKNFTVIDFLFYVYTPNIDQTIALVSQIGFVHDLIIDHGNVFFEINKLSPDKRFHTFLVDKDGNVLLIGNPTVDTEIRSLYLETINSISTGKSPSPGS
jgi:hypothetical protein